MASVLVAMTVLAAPAIAQAADSPAWVSRRLIQSFSFEETDDAGVPLGRTQPMPMHWYAAGRAADTADANFHSQPIHQKLQTLSGFPHFAKVGYAQDRSQSGAFSLALELNGGNAGAYVEIGAMSAIPGSEYLVEAAVQTADLVHARAYLEAYLVDVRGQIIEESRIRSKPLKTGSKWQPLSVSLPGRFNTAAWIGVEVKLLQPEPDPNNPLGKHQIVMQDVRARAWFDDIRVWQVPSVRVRTPTPTRIIRAPIDPELRINVRDLTGNRLLAKMRAKDEAGNVVDQESRVIGGGAPMQWRWRPKLPRYGFFSLELEIHETQGSHTGIIERVKTDIVWVPEMTPTAITDLKRFVLGAEDMPKAGAELIPSALDQLGLFGVVLSLWDADTNLLTAEDRVQWLGDLTQPLLSQGRRVDLSFYPAPLELIDHLGPQATETLALLNTPQDAWLPYAGPAFRVFGQRIDRWHLGSSEAPRAFDSVEGGQSIAPAQDTLASLVASPRTVVTWNMLQTGPPPAPADTEFWLTADASIAAEKLVDYLKAWPAGQTSVYLKPMPADESLHETRLADLIKRMAFAWQADVDSIAIPSAWRLIDQRHTYLQPDPLLAVFAQTAYRLSGRRVVGEMNLIPGVRCLILDTVATPGTTSTAAASGQGGMLIAWNESGPKDAALALNLGSAPVTIDPWGNRQSVETIDGKHHVPLTNTPVFIEGIDANLAIMRGRFRLDPPFVPASQRRHSGKLILSNPWPFTITGDLTIREPSTWVIQPAKHRFSIAAGQSASLDVAMTMPVSEVAGHKVLEADINLQTGVPLQVRMTTPVEVGLETVEVNASLALQSSRSGKAPDLVTTLTVKNTGDAPQSFYAFASLFGSPRQENFISALDPGETAIRRFYFKEQAATILNHAVRTGVRESRGPAMLNLRLTRDDLE